MPASTRAATSSARSPRRCRRAGVAGYIVSFPIPEVMMGINAFMLGAQSVNPDFKIKIVWVNSWFDPGKEADAAKALFDQGADIIVQHTDSPAPLQIAEERGLHGFGQSHDMIKFAPKAQYTAIVDNWGPYYVKRVKAVLDGTWKSQASWEGLKDEHAGHGALHQPARRRRGDGQGQRRRRSSRVSSIPSRGRSSSRTAPRSSARQEPRRRHAARHELVREGHRRPASAVGHIECALRSAERARLIARQSSRSAAS